MGEKKTVRIQDKVYEKNFRVTAMGFDAREVDSFLDEINRDIARLEKEADNLKRENDSLKSTIAEQNNTIRELKRSNFEGQVQESTSQTNIKYKDNLDLISRISNIENKMAEILRLLNEKK